MGWKTYVARRAILQRLPGGQVLRSAKRRLFGYRPDPTNIELTLEQFEALRHAAAQGGQTLAGATVLEIGSGWFPTIPLLMVAHGAREVLLSDHVPHLDATTFATTLDVLAPTLARFPELAGRRTLEDFHLRYLAPLRPAELADGSLDLVVSRTVLEHIDPPLLEQLLVGLRPKLAPGGLMVHCIDHSDHLEHNDRSLSKINFLTWSDRRHALVNRLTQEGENRLRHHEYRALFEACGYTVRHESGEPHEPTRRIAATLPLAGRFASMTPEQLSILTSYFVVAPRA